MFVVDRFVADCRAALAGADAMAAVKEILTEAVTDPMAVAHALGEPEHAGIGVLHRAPDLTVLNFTWAPWMCLRPHNHCMWSVIGIFSGREDNVFWRRTETAIEAAGARSVATTDVMMLGTDIIHSVVNPIGKFSRAIHVYGGDFFAPPHPRSEWDHETLHELPWDIEARRREFSEAEARYRATVG